MRQRKKAVKADTAKHDIVVMMGLHSYRPKRKRKRQVPVAQQKLAYTTAEAAIQLGMSERKVWELQNRGEIVTIREGRAVRVPHSALVEYLERKLISK